MTTETGAMDHKALTDRIPDLMADNIGRWQRWRLSRHLKSCSPCQVEVQHYQAIHSDLSETVPEILKENRHGDEFMERIRHTVAAQPLPARVRQRRFPIARVAVPTAAVALIVIVLTLVLNLGGSNELSALSLATPVRGAITVTQAGDPVADGTFGYVSPNEWERSTTFHRLPDSVATLSEITVEGETFSRLGDDAWRFVGDTPAERQPVPGLGDLGLAERLFDAVLNVYELKSDGETEFQGELLTRFRGEDSGYASQIRDSYLASGATEEEAAALFDFYSANRPEITVLADTQERIRAIFITIPVVDSTKPMRVELVIAEFNAVVDINSPLR